MIRTLRVARRSAIKMRTQVGIRFMRWWSPPPNSLRHQLRDLALEARYGHRSCATGNSRRDAASKLALRSLAIRYQGLTGSSSTGSAA